MRKSKTQDRLEAIKRVKGKMNLAVIWAEDVELSPTKVKELNEANQG